MSAGEWRPRTSRALRFALGPEGQLVLEHARTGWRGPCQDSVLALLRACDGTQSLEDLARGSWWPAGLSQPVRARLARSILEGLRARGLIQPSEGEGPAPRLGYDGGAVHRRMVADEVRTSGYRQAIEALVSPGDVVVDLGAGTGVLSLFAAQAGAAVVHALEQSQIARVAAEVVAENGGAETVRIHPGPAEGFELPGGADLLVSEWMGHFCLAEEMFPSFAQVRERVLRPGGRVLPSAVELFLAPLAAGEADGPPAGDTPAYWSGRPAGLSFEALVGWELEGVRSEVLSVAPARLLAPAQALARIDCLRDGAEALEFRASLSFRCQRAGLLAGFVGYFVAELAPGILLDTSPGAPPTHWEQHAFFLPPRAVARGDVLGVLFEAARGKWPGAPRYRIELTLAGERIAVEYGDSE